MPLNLHRHRRWLILALPACLLGLALRARPAAGRDPGPTDVPSGTVAFFSRSDGTCPQGYRTATEVSGRLVVGVTVGDSVGKLVGVPLTNQEDRTHVHPFTVAVDLPYKALAALDGGNRQGAAAQKYTSSGNSEPVASGLPMVQLVACVKQ